MMSPPSSRLQPQPATPLDIALDDQRLSARQAVEALIDGIGQVVVGLPQVIRRVVMGLLADGQTQPGKAVCGHMLLEAVPGTAKTLLCETLAACLQASFSRIQMDVDKRPGDIVGYDDIDPDSNRLTFRPGPIFANIVLIDELNRARPEVKSALLQAMAEREVSIDTSTYELTEPFFVMANQNPIEQEGAYPLIEAELDRFIAKIRLPYLAREDEREMVQRATRFATEEGKRPQPLLDGPQLIELRRFIREHIYTDAAVVQYAVDLTRATRPGDPLHASCLEDLMVDGRSLVQLGVSPRASLLLVNFAKVEAFLSTTPTLTGRAHVMPADVIAVAFDVLNHRLILDDMLVHSLLGQHPIPYLDDALREQGCQVVRSRDELLEQLVRRLLRGVPLP